MPARTGQHRSESETFNRFDKSYLKLYGIQRVQKQTRHAYAEMRSGFPYLSSSAIKNRGERSESFKQRRKACYNENGLGLEGRKSMSERGRERGRESGRRVGHESGEEGKQGNGMTKAPIKGGAQ